MKSSLPIFSLCFEPHQNDAIMFSAGAFVFWTPQTLHRKIWTSSLDFLLFPIYRVLKCGRQRFAVFHTALIWALEKLVDTSRRLPTQTLLSTILRAPNFPKEWLPRLWDRGVVCWERLVLAPLNANGDCEPDEIRAGNQKEIVRQDLSVRFILTTRSLLKEWSEN